MSLEFGYALGSIFALGGIGSASIIIALKETMENMLGGILIRFNDKFRVGDSITLGGKTKEQGKVAEITYLATTLLLEDNSEVSVPNKIFTTGEVINWSRTNYRLFKTTVLIPIRNLQSLPTVVNSIRHGLESMPEVEKEARDVKVAATGFDAESIQLSVTLHFNSARGTDALKTQAINIIANCVKSAM
jgi:small-conductance mechanosensitive channel